MGSTFTILEEDEVFDVVDMEAPLVHVAYELPFSHDADEGGCCPAGVSLFWRIKA